MSPRLPEIEEVLARNHLITESDDYSLVVEALEKKIPAAEKKLKQSRKRFEYLTSGLVHSSEYRSKVTNSSNVRSSYPVD
jgi:hypothetical protein